MRTLLMMIGIGLLITACTQPATLQPEPDPNAVQTQVAEAVAATLQAGQPEESEPTDVSTETPSETPEPDTTPTETAPEPTSEPTLEPTTTPAPPPPPDAVVPTGSLYPQSVYTLDPDRPQRFIEGYAIRSWIGSTNFVDDYIVTIQHANHPMVTIEQAVRVDELSGSDLSGSGFPNVVIHTYSGGAHCCSGMLIYDLTPTAMVTQFVGEPSQCGYYLADLNGDTIYEIQTCDDIFAYVYCPYAGSPFPSVFLSYDAASGSYRPNSPAFSAEYASQRPSALNLAETMGPGGMGEWDNTNKCSVLHLVLSDLYSGQTELGWSEYERLYSGPDKAAFRVELVETLASSPYYVQP